MSYVSHVQCHMFNQDMNIKLIHNQKVKTCVYWFGVLLWHSKLQHSGDGLLLHVSLFQQSG